jgi:signal-transduction protein with cAMP-binding, CBS, and nucleotidyltransferase domain
LELSGPSRVSALSDPEELDMEKEDLKRTKPPLARSDKASEEGDVLMREKPSDLKDAFEILKKLEDVAKRAKDYTEANEGDLEED